MKVRELIARLQCRDLDAPVYVYDGDCDAFILVDEVSRETGSKGTTPALKALPEGALVIWGA